MAASRHGRLRWISVAARNCMNVGEYDKNKDLEDDPKAIQETRRYLEDVERVIASNHDAREFDDAMIRLYPDRKNRSALWFWGAKELFKAQVKST